MIFKENVGGTGDGVTGCGYKYSKHIVSLWNGHSFGCAVFSIWWLHDKRNGI